jgi:mitochondrial fission protein ELM1
LDEGPVTVWCLLGRKAGDNTQVRALATELGFGCVEKNIAARAGELLVHLGPAATLAGIRREASSPLQAPWPDLVITAGRRNEPVARWIRKQSGGRTRLVHIGRPWAPLSSWDLIITTPQYFLPEQPNVLHNSLPLHSACTDELDAAGGELLPRIEHLPRPRIAVLAGGDSGRFVMTADKAERLGALASRLADAAGGSLLVTDSPRTPREAGDAMQSRLRAAHFCYRWTDGSDNPYRGFLALADAFVVTGESMSMLGEAVDTGRPLFIFDMGDGDTPWWRLAHGWRYKPLSHRFAMRLGPRRMRRDIGRIQGALVESGRASWLDMATLDMAARRLQQDNEAAAEEMERGGVALAELRRSAEAVRRLVTSR